MANISCTDVERNIESVVCPVCDKLIDDVTEVAGGTPAQAAVENFCGGFICGAQYALQTLNEGKLIEDKKEMLKLFIDCMEEVLNMHIANRR